MSNVGLTPFIDRLISGESPSDVNIYMLWLLYLCNTVEKVKLNIYRLVKTIWS